MTPQRIILGLLADGSKMTLNEIRDLTGWSREEAVNALSKACACGIVKSLKRFTFFRTDL